MRQLGWRRAWLSLGGEEALKACKNRIHHLQKVGTGRRLSQTIIIWFCVFLLMQGGGGYWGRSVTAYVQQWDLFPL